ncbi:MAG: tRNA threonylcarbamoyladenosine dehydratase [Bacteroidales bacterium]|jgi:tRNA A37 threonylcarbamoyladenosine dehydratase|nr:tRNA threonylcarbamoyladenosine dehydratase [Bacteroidales bacterium]MDD3702030.1 tRNA threonylcarbamoyladenosine dehydratase [Bacteroidales bacterium]MDY0369723.1 tRNA threonylcarbamoyladenosine dehydratase [Bacteroidales bacterium]
MTEHWQERSLLLLGQQKLETLAKSHVLVAGLGGVGAYCAEQLVRSGIGKLTIVDGDKIKPSNRNRQLIALHSTDGMLKTTAMQDRLLDINPELELHTVPHYIKDQALLDVLNHPYDYVVDAIDTLAPKVYLLYHARKAGFAVVSSMGAGGKLDPSQIEVVDIGQTTDCRLAYYIRKKLHKLDVWDGITAVYSPEKVASSAIKPEKGEMNKRSTVGTISYMPALFGCICASVVIRQLIE